MGLRGSGLRETHHLPVLKLNIYPGDGIMKARTYDFIDQLDVPGGGRAMFSPASEAQLPPAIFEHLAGGAIVQPLVVPKQGELTLSLGKDQGSPRHLQSHGRYSDSVRGVNKEQRRPI